MSEGLTEYLLHTTDVDGLISVLGPLAAESFSGTLPASTLLGTTRLAFPQLKIEIEPGVVPSAKHGGPYEIAEKRVPGSPRGLLASETSPDPRLHSQYAWYPSIGGTLVGWCCRSPDEPPPAWETPTARGPPWALGRQG